MELQDEYGHKGVYRTAIVVALIARWTDSPNTDSVCIELYQVRTTCDD
jgi:hypothetical protein